MILPQPLASAAIDLPEFVARVLAPCPDIRAAWSLGHPSPAAPSGEQPLARAPSRELLVFASPFTLHRLRKTEDRYRRDVEVLVVFDGDAFESAWGLRRRSGSLARWAWRESGEGVAYYDEARWGRDGSVVRTRAKALLLWRAQ